jgi:DNA-binding MarR family transcriptional regulator
MASQGNPIGHAPEPDVFAVIIRAADAVWHGLMKGLRPLHLTPAQYDVLRILRWAGERGLACREIAQRMMTRAPDVTRLLDRLERRGLVVRERERADRRVVRTRITAEGAALADRAQESVEAFRARRFGHLGRDQVRSLVSLLMLAREEP